MTSFQIYGPDSDKAALVFFQPSSLPGEPGPDPLGRSVFTYALGSVIGSWLGAFPIPLDWDRPWQAWPITCCLGAVAGHAVASMWEVVKALRTPGKGSRFTKIKKKQK